jgi:hypothetical protein
MIAAARSALLVVVLAFAGCAAVNAPAPPSGPNVMPMVGSDGGGGGGSGGGMGM